MKIDFLIAVSQLTALTNFLVGWGASSASTSAPDYYAPPQQQDSVKQRLLTLIHAIRTLLRFPLVFMNVLIIAYELIAG
jgi:hypothetical protein